MPDYIVLSTAGKQRQVWLSMLLSRRAAIKWCSLHSGWIFQLQQTSHGHNHTQTTQVFLHPIKLMIRMKYHTKIANSPAWPIELCLYYRPSTAQNWKISSKGLLHKAMLLQWPHILEHFFFLSYFSPWCDQVSEKTKIKGGKIYYCSWCERV